MDYPGVNGSIIH